MILPELRKTRDETYIHPDDPAKRVSVSEQEAAILEGLVLDRFVLEVGTGLGVSTMRMTKTAIHILTVDNDPWVYRLPISGYNIERARFIPFERHFDLAFLCSKSSFAKIHKIRAPLFAMCIRGEEDVNRP